MGDPGGTGKQMSSQKEGRESATSGTKQLANAQLATGDRSTVPLGVSQERQQNRLVDQALKFRTKRSNMQITAEGDDEGGEEHRETTSVDYDDESIAQNF